jgi:hypothetical protein
VVTLMLVLLGTAPLDATLKAAHSLRVPGLIVQLTLFTYRYVALVADELARVRLALRVRGYRNRPTRHSYRTIGQVAGTSSPVARIRSCNRSPDMTSISGSSGAVGHAVEPLSGLVSRRSEPSPTLIGFPFTVTTLLTKKMFPIPNTSTAPRMPKIIAASRGVPVNELVGPPILWRIVLAMTQVK